MKNSQIFKYLTIVIAIVSVLTIGVGIYNIVVVTNKVDNTTSDKIDTLKNEYYVVGKNPTEVQTTNFKELTKALESSETDGLEIADYVTKAFIMDFFTWSNKDGAWDVGGQQYVYNYGLFFKSASYNYYADIDIFIEKYGKENLPQVKSVTTNAMHAADYEIDGNVYKAYYIEANWEYESNSTLDPNQFQKQAFFTVINNGGKFEIVRFYDNYD